MKNKDNIKILVIEDEATLLNAIEKKLANSGIEAVSCLTAAEAVKSLEGGDLPDAIWLDYYLPDVNGIEFMSLLKKNPFWSHIPVVVVSNSASSQKKSAMLALGAKEYFLKAEHKLEDIIATIIGIVEKSKGEVYNDFAN